MRYLYEKNGYGEHIFEFNPATPHDWYMLEDALDSAIRMVEQRKPDWSRKIAKQKCMDQKGFYNCNQLFSPKVNLSEEQIRLTQDPYASLTLHFRDDHDGDIYLQCEYLDFMDPTNGIDEPVKTAEPALVEDW